MAFENRRTVVAHHGPSVTESLRRLAVVIFAIVQGLIVLRIALLLLDARQENGLVHTIINASQVFVAPFENILKTNVINFNGPAVDAAAILALIGWTIVELLVVAALAVFHTPTRSETVRTIDGLPPAIPPEETPSTLPAPSLPGPSLPSPGGTSRPPDQPPAT